MVLNRDWTPLEFAVLPSIFAMSSSSFGNLFFWTALLFSLSHLIKLKADKCPHSEQKCGSMVIPYPFRIKGKGKEDSCGLSGFEIHCKKDESFGTTEPMPFLPLNDSLEVRILNISHGHLLFNSTQFYASSCDVPDNIMLPSQGPFRISENNMFVTVGCDTLGSLLMLGEGSLLMLGERDRYSGCFSYCDESLSFSDHLSFSDCNGIGCCHSPVPPNYTAYTSVMHSFNISLMQKGTCGYSAVIDTSISASVPKSSIRNFINGHNQMRLDWAIPNDTCRSAKAKSSYQCDHNAECEDKKWGYLCKCKKGYKGDGYVNGTACNDIDECKDPQLNDCYSSSKGGGCRNTNGFYECYCTKGSGDGHMNGTRCNTKSFQSLALTIGVSIMLVAVLVGGAALLWIHRQRKGWLAKQKNFRRNGGAHLQKLIASQAEAMTIFSLDEMEKATKKFSPSLVLGAGGYGTVYKGTLSEGTLVAIKKSMSIEADSMQIDQFINEIVILSKINHINVVKLLGCCLETPVPLLVYEYISNGTLFDQLFENKYEQLLQWEDRLGIAGKTAEALSYLHSAAIVHRDVKTSNILLGDGYISKVADFGLSRLLPMDQTHITTGVQGTLGYLDPEYFQSLQLTEKSDVYSFGVVMVELLTGLKAVSYDRMKNPRNLAIVFLMKMKTNDLLEILDSRLNIEEARYVESMGKVADLAKECLSMEGEKRPTMKEVAQELLWIQDGPRRHPPDVAQNKQEMIGLIVEDGAKRRRHAQMGADVAQNKEEIIALLEDGASVQHSRAIGGLHPNTMPQGLSVSFSIESFTNSLTN